MKHSFVLMLGLGVIFTAMSALAQTPQQLEMLKSRGDIAPDGLSEENEPVYFDKKTGELVIPQNSNQEMMDMDDGSKAPVPVAKSDEEIEATRRGLRGDLMEKMTPEQQQQYADYMMQDRIFLSTTDFRITTTSTGMQYCQMRLNVFNYTPRQLKQIHVEYTWGDTKTFADFTDVGIRGNASVGIALAGDVCNRVTKGAKFNVTTCSMEGLTADQCRLRLAEM